MSKIHYIVPYDLGGNYGKACNDACNLIPDNDYICIKDGDVMFLNKDWGRQFADLVNVYPDAGLITCLTNRIGNLQQCYQGQISENRDIVYHRNIALTLQKTKYLEVQEITTIISGHVMLFSKKTWLEVGMFPEELSERGLKKFTRNINTVDNRFSHRVLKAGKKILCAQGVYVLHYYRMLEGQHNRDHIK